jgi:hypothetical protein
MPIRVRDIKQAIAPLFACDPVEIEFELEVEAAVEGLLLELKTVRPSPSEGKLILVIGRAEKSECDPHD